MLEQTPLCLGADRYHSVRVGLIVPAFDEYLHGYLVAGQNSVDMQVLSGTTGTGHAVIR